MGFIETYLSFKIFIFSVLMVADWPPRTNSLYSPGPGWGHGGSEERLSNLEFRDRGRAESGDTQGLSPQSRSTLSGFHLHKEAMKHFTSLLGRYLNLC